MIKISNYQLENLPTKTEERSERSAPILSILLFDFNAFRKEVFFFRSNYEGPDYFNFLENITELQSLMDSMIQQLKIQVGDLNKIPYRSLSNSLEFPFEMNKVQIKSDTEGITLMLLGLTNLIQTNRKAAIEAEGLEDYFIESLLLEFERELERSRWVFHLFSKY